MYEAHFGLNAQPFTNTPDTGRFFAGADRGAVLDALLYAIDKGEAIVKVVGEVGSGKTMLCRMLQMRLPSKVETVYLSNPSLSPETIVHAVASELCLNVRYDMNKLEVLHMLQHHLVKLHAQNKQVVVLVEEAQAMPLATLEEIRLLSNLETQRHKLIQVVLFGQPELDEKLAVREMRQFVERISHSFSLAPFSPNDVRDYLNFRLAKEGSAGVNLFSDAVARAIFRYSKGLARRVNFLADKALLAAFADSATSVMPKHVRRAAKDCEFVKRWHVPVLRFTVPMVAAFCVTSGVLVYAVDDSPQPIAVAEASATSESVRLPDESGLNAEYGPSADGGPEATRVAVARQSNVEKRAEATETWVAATNRKNYTIQLSTSFLNRPEQLRGLQRLLDSDEMATLRDKMFVHRGEINSQPVLVLTYEAFPDYQSAAGAASALPPPLGDFKPLVRSIASLRAELTR